MARASIREIQAAVRSKEVSAAGIVDSCLAKIDACDAHLRCFTHLATDSARAQAMDIDHRIAQGADIGALAGVPFAVKDLFDVAGEVTHAGAKLRLAEPPAETDAPLVARLKAADAIYLGRLNMDEFAYGFATVNAHFGTTRNPHDPDRLAGGSSGGSAASVAADLVPLTLGSDTNGSVRVPASLCGLFGLRPTHGSLSMQGVFPFVDPLDTVGPFTQSLDDMKLAFRTLSTQPAPEKQKRMPRVARLGGWFRRNGDPDGYDGVDAIGAVFDDAPLIELPLAEAARSAAFLITAKHGGLLHQETLQQNAMGYDPAVRDRLVAGIALSDDKVDAAKAIIQAFNDQLQAALTAFDILIAPSTPSVAPKISDSWIDVDGQRVSARANLGLYTQPLSVAGVPILSVPLKRPGKLPLGLQLIGRKNEEECLFSAADKLVQKGLVGFTLPSPRPIKVAS